MIIKEINQDINSDKTYISHLEVSGALFISFEDAPKGYWIHERNIHIAIKEYIAKGTPIGCGIAAQSDV